MIDVSPYLPTIWAMAAIGSLLLIQVLVVDLAGIKAGHKPGTPVEANTSSFLFRATRAHANTNETIAIFIIFAVAGVLSSVPANWLNYAAWGYLGSRVIHMLSYYANWSLVRSIAFGFSLAGLFGMLVAIAKGWVS